MFLSELRIENFRMYGEKEKALVLPLRPGLTALVGENDAGKTTIIDALRLALGTRDQEFFRVEEADYHQPADGESRRTEIRIRCKFDDLNQEDEAAFIEYITYENKGADRVLYVNWKAVAKNRGYRRFTSVEVRSGKAGDGPQLDSEARDLLRTTYLRPLRDAERALAAGRSSRLSQILQHTKQITECGQDYDPERNSPADPRDLSILGIGDYANALLGSHEGVKSVRDRLNREFLGPLSFSGDQLQSSISVVGSRQDAGIRLRQLLEKLELELCDQGTPEPPPGRGLGSNNLLFMACELLLLGSEREGLPLLLLEEPEAHLHPQRQLRFMQFLDEQVRGISNDGQRTQVILTTHSPNLASAIDLDSLVLLSRGKAFALASGNTCLDKADYGFLKRFLDVTKANMFFARGLMIVEGDAENILLPTLARLIGRDFTKNGVSIVNVGGTGLRRFARIYQRESATSDGIIDVPIACVTDFDVMPDCAPEIMGKTAKDEEWPDLDERHWHAEKDFTPEQLKQRRASIDSRASGQRVRTFIADKWTLEYDLAYHGLARDVWIAAHLAKADERISAQRTTAREVIHGSLRSFVDLSRKGLPMEELASHVYAQCLSSSVSKATTAQYLAVVLELRHVRERRSPETLRLILPPYLVNAIDYVTVQDTGDGQEKCMGAKVRRDARE